MSLFQKFLSLFTGRKVSKKATVASLTAEFTRTASKLRQLAEAKNEESEKLTQAIAKAEADRKAANEEGNKALVVAAKIESLLA